MIISIIYNKLNKPWRAGISCRLIVFIIFFPISSLSQNIIQNNFDEKMKTEDDYVKKTSKNWESSICKASEIVFSPRAKYIAAITKESQPNIGFESNLGAEVYILSLSETKPNGMMVAYDARSFSFNSNYQFVIGGLHNRINIYNLNKISEFERIKTIIRPNLGKASFQRSYLNIINWNEKDENNIISIFNNPIETPKGYENYFAQTELDSGLLSRTVLDGKIYDIGSFLGGTLVSKKENGELTRISNEIDSYSFSDLSFAKYDNGELFLKSTGLIANYSNNYFKPIKTPFYVKVIRKSDNKFLKIAYSANKIIALSNQNNKEALRLQTIVDKWISNGWYIKSITFDQVTKKYAILFNGFKKNEAIISIFNANKFYNYYCNQIKTRPTIEEIKNYSKVFDDAGLPHDDNYRIFIDDFMENYTRFLPPTYNNYIIKTKYKTVFKEIGENSHLVGKWEINPTGQIKGKIIFIRGGSASNLRDFRIDSKWETLLKQGWQINSYEYSGAIDTNAELYSRLKKNRDLTLLEDALVIKNDILKGKKVPLLLITNSFGSTLSSYLLEEIGDEIKYSFFSVPFGKWRASKNINQVIFDNRTFGAPKDEFDSDINEWLEKRKKIVCSHKNVQFLFGKYDELVKPQDWTDTCGDKINFKIFENVGHSSNKEIDDIIIEKASTLVSN